MMSWTRCKSVRGLSPRPSVATLESPFLSKGVSTREESYHPRTERGKPFAFRELLEDGGGVGVKSSSGWPSRCMPEAAQRVKDPENSPFSISNFPPLRGIGSVGSRLLHDLTLPRTR